MPKLKRSEKGRRVVRWVTGNSGVPGLFYDRSTGLIAAPRPLKILLVTDRSLARFSEAIRSLPDQGINAVIRYDGDIPSVDHAMVGMTLRTFALLLEHAKANGGITDVVDD